MFDIQGIIFSRNAEIGQKNHLWVDTKGSRKNNFTFWHLIFKSFLAYFKNQKP